MCSHIRSTSKENMVEVGRKEGSAGEASKEACRDDQAEHISASSRRATLEERNRCPRDQRKKKYSFSTLQETQ
jgi:hypothetical protein